ncbi:hypothetical protein KBY58_03065 [Cyanobium sp. HWJ4-Hawea]|uniref:hypothetical protein n=1 Tax=unclassified Cyanobium TaxID=2627006 RepID=UPI0020CC898E|nr:MULTISPECIES: hypothetical protein [unclassified Cyanobium]MCP9774472.1 hypothetical protein [Cyanobium sp. WAJ14-Wanaka]MCP9808413.1 hypothetical protein [Cyanobium sp. HWJ4-Hawea]
MPVFQNAFGSLLSLAPSPLFAKARQLYLRKYPLETTPAASAEPLANFRTFLLEETVQESSEGVLRVRSEGFAVVHWQAGQTTLSNYRTYLLQRWQIEPDSLELMVEPWFREGGAWALFRTPAVYERSFTPAPQP